MALGEGRQEDAGGNSPISLSPSFDNSAAATYLPLAHGGVEGEGEILPVFFWFSQTTEHAPPPLALL